MQYYKKINIDYDHGLLTQIADSYMNLAQDGFTSHNGEYITYASVAEKLGANSYSVKSLYLKDIPDDFTGLEMFDNLAKIFKRTKEDIYKYSQYFIIEGSLSPHIDKRTAAFTIPLKGVDSPIVWYDADDNVLDSYTYEGPTLIDTHTKHGALDNSHLRLHFQVGGFTKPFSEIVENI
tara:strand:+ start:294 stop:827 length:534 start_codon:yes stop_codon:yes gene_type:complete